MYGPDRYALTDAIWQECARAEISRDATAIGICQLMLDGYERSARWMLDEVFRAKAARVQELTTRAEALVNSWKAEQEQTQ
ncbi:hypothetical protein PWG14_24230 [Chromobacterium amazonense]|uniref:hypothetical protein n=1 Tax=Chromobacterium amazonense TaxID=1382803 RepID=UPI00237EC663|nr:hypothetical protein [Chromobacterium amazonense]MDE1715576.1 hypothetical protein [Chromobacterium amazonense]